MAVRTGARAELLPTTVSTANKFDFVEHDSLKYQIISQTIISCDDNNNINRNLRQHRSSVTAKRRHCTMYLCRFDHRMINIFLLVSLKIFIIRSMSR